MSHHYSGPDFTCPQDDARVDLCDLFAFPKPEDPSRSILIMDVHPAVSVNPERTTSNEPFALEAIYELKIDTDRDAVADIAYRFRFSPYENGAQNATVRRIEGVGAAGEFSLDGSLLTYEAKIDMSEELAQKTAQYCAAISLMFNTLASSLTDLSAGVTFPAISRTRAGSSSWT